MFLRIITLSLVYLFTHPSIAQSTSNPLIGINWNDDLSLLNDNDVSNSTGGWIFGTVPSKKIKRGKTKYNYKKGNKIRIYTSKNVSLRSVFASGDEVYIKEGNKVLYSLNGSYDEDGYNGEVSITFFEYLDNDKQYKPSIPSIIGVMKGVYINNKRHGKFEYISKYSDLKISLYYKNGILDNLNSELELGSISYKGEINKNIKASGYGELTLNNNKAYYKGDFKNNQPSGKGVYKQTSGLIYDGNWNNGNFTSGRVDYPDGSYYEGKILNNEFFIEGIYKSKEFTYKGNFRNQQFHGKGYVNHTNGDSYDGNFVNGKYEGIGIYKSKEYTYTGSFKNSKFHGSGYLEYTNGDSYDGEWRNGEMSESINYKNLNDNSDIRYNRNKKQKTTKSNSSNKSYTYSQNSNFQNRVVNKKQTKSIKKLENETSKGTDLIINAVGSLIGSAFNEYLLGSDEWIEKKMILKCRVCDKMINHLILFKERGKLIKELEDNPLPKTNFFERHNHDWIKANK
ncbi:hypothetical protein [uncultured Polaribacter sp.]|uniref:MORN repeat-containing protein n=1 Tax=uncultured Polaribacter sp. TaxID=174711 RepID=UPI00262571BB|nr:hypothetical protein [uncultured Polaribacter sp.]